MSQPKRLRRSGKEVRLPSPPPLRTGRAPLDASGSSLLERPSRDAAHPVSLPRAVDLPMAMRVQQLQVVEPLITPSTAPDPMVDVPGLVFRLKPLPAHHASTPLSLPEILDPASACQGMRQLPGRPLLQVEFPLRIVGV